MNLFKYDNPNELFPLSFWLVIPVSFAIAAVVLALLYVVGVWVGWVTR